MPNGNKTELIAAWEWERMSKFIPTSPLIKTLMTAVSANMTITKSYVVSRCLPVVMSADEQCKSLQYRRVSYLWILYSSRSTAFIFKAYTFTNTATPFACLYASC